MSIFNRAYLYIIRKKVKRNFVKATGKTYVDDVVVAEANFTFVIADL